MRVLMVTDFYPPVVRGGLEFHVDSLATELADRGHDVHVVTQTKGAAPEHPAVRVHRVEAAVSSLISYEEKDRPFHPPLPDPKARRQLGRVLDEVQPDVVHGHNWLTVSLPPDSPPLVYTAHDYSLVCQLRTMFRTDGVLCSGPGLRCVPCGRRRYGTAKSLVLGAGTVTGRSRIQPSAFIAVSTAIRDALAPHLRRPVITIPGFLPKTANFSARRPDGVPDGPYVMFAGDPGDHKGLDVLLSLWDAPEPPPVTLLVATTKTMPRPVPPGVVVTALPREEVFGAWSGADVAVVPSRWPEPFGTVALEAMTAGTPVLVSKVGGLRDVVRDGVDGYHLRPEDPADLRARLDQLLTDPALAARLGAAGRERAHEFRADAVVPQIEDLYATVAGVSPRRGGLPLTVLAGGRA